ncbi:MAG: serine hydrolase [Gammaproteobacteria bacterium]|nr:serine hydrolase [Gammaproteobacteria bacterium]
MTPRLPTLLLMLLTLLSPLLRADGSGGAAPRGIEADHLQRMIERAGALGPIHALLVSRDGITVAGHHFAGPGLDAPTNIKSLSKTVQSALAGIAIERGLIENVDQPITSLLARLPADAEPKLAAVTVDHLLSMRAGLGSTSGRNYGRWVASDDWVAHALSRPFVDPPGERMQYSTGVWHILSAILTERSGQSTLALARRWLGQPLGIHFPAWPQDPDGIYFGGNDMLMSPRDLLTFGELYLQNGRNNGSTVLPQGWIEQSWIPRARSPWSGDDYGYGWFITELAGERVYYGRGYGGQLLHVVPALGIVVVITSRPTPPSAGGSYVRALHDLVAAHVIAGARAADAPSGLQSRSSPSAILTEEQFGVAKGSRPMYKTGSRH